MVRLRIFKLEVLSITWSIRRKLGGTYGEELDDKHIEYYRIDEY